MKKAKRKKEISVVFPDVNYAILVSREYTENDYYLENLIGDCISSSIRVPINEMSLATKKHYGRIIKSIADKISQSRLRKKGREEKQIELPFNLQ